MLIMFLHSELHNITTETTIGRKNQHNSRNVFQFIVSVFQFIETTQIQRHLLHVLLSGENCGFKYLSCSHQVWIFIFTQFSIIIQFAFLQGSQPFFLLVWCIVSRLLSDDCRIIVINVCARVKSNVSVTLFWIEPSHENMALFVLRKLIIQTHMRTHPVGLDVSFLVGPFVYSHTLCVRTAKALVRLCGCVCSPEPSLVIYVISTIISWAGSILLFSINVITVQSTVFCTLFFAHLCSMKNLE